MENILVAFAGSDPASGALALAADLAARDGATLHLVHVIPRPMVVIRGAEGIRPDRARGPSRHCGDVRTRTVHHRGWTSGGGRRDSSQTRG